ncbi:hypothetical protein EV193_10552 [Herbihabitans rhizosphaerae]|uniref:LigA protein n=1 Tax=Herbihabitans rhizosphaerae TaxID=1872711 RepID=A0A4Q7KMJ4_9PSEU|nr:hypothetical protein [Herbihabitans rhizosphaerae]RZS37497.1 hypothetical protein EV193_10552 [Herbihabitans rhizosphaerae]
MTTATVSAPVPGHYRPSRLTVIRYVVGYAAILGTIPYLALKFAWLSGSTIGFRDTSLASDNSIVVLNGVTAGMDLIAVLIALAFTHAWGQRLPAWLVIVPMWVATGLLVPIAIMLPLAGMGELVASDASSTDPGVLEPWVQPMVYGGFAWQGVMLVIAFLLYARVRWAAVFTARTEAARPGATHAVQKALATGTALAAALIALGYLGVAVGAFTQGRESMPVTGHLVYAMHGVLVIAGAGGLLAMVRRWRGPFWLPLALAWTGAGGMFAWGAWTLTVVLADTALSGGAQTPVLDNMLNFGKLVLGVVIGVTSLMLLAERPATNPAAHPRRSRFDQA